MRRQLLSIAAELARLSGWTCFDSRLCSTARNFFEESLRLAKDNGDMNFVANILSSLSLQGTYEGRSPMNAVALARAGQDACRQTATPRVMAMLSMREAFAHAALKDEASCRRTIDDAQRHLEEADDVPGDPPWVSYFTELKLKIDTGIALSKLGDVKTATPILAQAVAEAESTNARNLAFHSYWLAATLVASGEIDQAGVTATETLEIAENVESRRVLGHIGELHSMLAPHRTSTAVRDFHDRATTFLQEADR
ncbi:hypothetical protein OG948_47235 (plasmid) [Embleya sp. NBC_00888]|uniref:hypothetical protein n=1 Tax=Embleya sp. NBC_00888 TaxID=2975960 RepID=UPI002F90A7FB|nr:hypothetical protein OG948_47235 [Embleya sp. NBC_00888]